MILNDLTTIRSIKYFCKTIFIGGEQSLFTGLNSFAICCRATDHIISFAIFNELHVVFMTTDIGYIWRIRKRIFNAKNHLLVQWVHEVFDIPESSSYEGIERSDTR